MTMLADARAIARETLRSFSRHGGRMLAAAVAFSSLLSVAPLLVIALQVAGLATSQAAARAALAQDLTRWIGEDGARTVALLLDRVQSTHAGRASAASALILAYASTRLFSQLKRALDHMWDVQPRSGEGFRGKAWKQLRKRALAFAMVLLVGVVLVALVLAKALLAAAAETIGGPFAGVAWRIGELALSLATTTALFAMVFKVMPDARLAWRDAWVGALVTALLFTLGAALIGIYLGHKALAATYGAAASIVMLLLWVHYSAQVFFVGAAFTAVFAARRGRPIEPNSWAIGARERTSGDAAPPGDGDQPVTVTDTDIDTLNRNCH